jgi:hypothetical protein
MEDFRELVAEQAKLELCLRFLAPQDHRTSACLEQIVLLRIAMHREDGIWVLVFGKWTAKTGTTSIVCGNPLYDHLAALPLARN